jgi:hypothetical protein
VKRAVRQDALPTPRASSRAAPPHRAGAAPLPHRFADLAPSAPRDEMPIQRTPITWSDLKTNATGSVQWAPHKTQPSLANTDKTTALPATVAEGVGAEVVGTTAPGGWKPFAQSKGTHGTWGSLGVTAMIAPQPAPAATGTAPWNVPAFLATESQKPYSQAPLVPTELGVAEVPENRVALPSASLPALQSAQKRLETIVASLRWGFGDFTVVYASENVTVQPAVIGALEYARTISVRIGEVVRLPDGKPDFNPQGTSHITINLPSPAQHRTGTAETSDVPQQIPGTTVRNKAFGTLSDVAPHAATAASWKTRITFGPTFHGDGTSMVADPLGPDHKIGEEPVNSTSGGGKTIWSARTAELTLATGNKKATYVAGHLLNHHLGGPGNDARNLAPIPAEANDKHESEVESPIKRLVNVDRRWVYYSVVVHEAFDVPTQTEFPDSFTCLWYQLDTNNREIPNTRGSNVITIAPPSSYGTTANVLGTAPVHATAQSGGAETAFAYNQVLLDDTDTLKYQRRVMSDLVGRLEKVLDPKYFMDPRVRARLSTFLAYAAPNAAEIGAFKTIEQIAGDVQGIATFGDLTTALPALKIALKNALEAATLAMRARLDRTTAAAKERLGFTDAVVNPVRVAVHTALTADSEHFGVMSTVIEEFGRLIEVAEAQANQNRAEIVQAAVELHSWLIGSGGEVTTAHELIGLFRRIVDEIRRRVVEPLQTPMSPNQQIGAFESETGRSAQSGSEASHQHVLHRAMLDLGVTPVLQVPTPKKYGAVLLYLAKAYKSASTPLPAYHGPATKLANFVDMYWKSMIDEDALTYVVESAYHAKTSDVNDYVERVFQPPEILVAQQHV